jgi:hypothetical protein
MYSVQRRGRGWQTRSAHPFGRALGWRIDARRRNRTPRPRRSQRARGRPCRRQTWGRNFGARPARLAVTEGNGQRLLSPLSLLVFAFTLSILPRTQTRHTQWLAKRLVTRPPPSLPPGPLPVDTSQRFCPSTTRRASSTSPKASMTAA